MPQSPPEAHPVKFNRQTRQRLWGMIRAFWASDAGRPGRLLLATMLVLLIGINVLNVINSYVGRDFMTSIERRQWDVFVSMGMMYLGVFAASTLVAVVQRFVEETLALRWRTWLTQEAVQFYIAHRTYFWLKDEGSVENPDQRITEDIRFLTTTTLSLALIALNASFTVVAFAGVLWSIHRTSFFVAVGYAVIGSGLTFLLGRPLVGLNYRQFDCEASLRTAIVHVRENAESVALLRRDGRLQARILGRLAEVAGNMRRMISVNRNMGFFTTGYNYLIQLIPVAMVAPAFMRGEVEFGIITQTAMAFTHLVAACSIIITQFQSISTYAAVVTRLGSLLDAIEGLHKQKQFSVKLHKDASCLAYEGLTLRGTDKVRPLICNLSASIACGTNVLVKAGDPAAANALFRVTAGLWQGDGEGVIRRPDLDDIYFLPERPYLPPGTLRQALVRVGMEDQVDDARILQVLGKLGIKQVIERVGGLDTEADWDNLLSLSEQQVLCATRVVLTMPRMVLIERLDSTLGPESLPNILELMRGAGITYVVFDGRHADLRCFNAMLVIAEDGTSAWQVLDPPGEPECP